MIKQRMRGGVIAATALGGLLALTGCGDGGNVQAAAGSPSTEGADSSPAETAAGAGTPAYGALLDVLARAKVPTCDPNEGTGGFIALPKPAAEVARDHSWFRYLEGRIYEFGPCQLAPGKRNELRVFRYADTAARDLALTEISQRGTRPTSTFAYEGTVAIEIWSPEPSLESPVGQLAQVVHSSIGALPQAWHLDVPGS